MSGGTAGGITSRLRGARAENEALKQQLADLEVRLQEQRALAARTVQLQELLDLQTSHDAADGRRRSHRRQPQSRHPERDRQPRQRRRRPADMAVISPKGIVGRVIGRPASHASRVQLLIDPAAAAGALVERTRVGRDGRRASTTTRRCSCSSCRTWLTSSSETSSSPPAPTASIRGASPSARSRSRSAGTGCTARLPCDRRWTSRASRKCSSCSCPRTRPRGLSRPPPAEREK